MNKIVITSLLALSFLTGFTCSKNTPAETTQQAAPAQEQMAAPTAPADATAAAPAQGQPAGQAPAAAAPAPADASAAPAAPATTK